MEEEIIKENLKNIDIEKLALNPKFGSLTFNNSAKKLAKIKS